MQGGGKDGGNLPRYKKMVKPWALRKRAQFIRIYRSGRVWRNRFISVKTIPNGLALSRYGFSISKNLGKAVVRNRMRRILKDIIRKKQLSAGWDIVFSPFPSAVEANYNQLSESINRLMIQAHLLVDDFDEASGNRTN